MNRAFISGEVVREPEAKTIPGKGDKQHLLVEFDIINTQIMPWGQEKKAFWQICAWNKSGESILGTVHAGDKVIVEGELEKDIWDDKETGKKREKAKIVAREVTFLRESMAEEVAQQEPVGEPPF